MHYSLYKIQIELTISYMTSMKGCNWTIYSTILVLVFICEYRTAFSKARLKSKRERLYDGTWCLS